MLTPADYSPNKQVFQLPRWWRSDLLRRMRSGLPQGSTLRSLGLLHVYAIYFGFCSPQTRASCANVCVVRLLEAVAEGALALPLAFLVHQIGIDCVQ